MNLVTNIINIINSKSNQTKEDKLNQVRKHCKAVSIVRNKKPQNKEFYIKMLMETL